MSFINNCGLPCKERQVRANAAGPYVISKVVPANDDGEIVCSERLGGVLEYFHRSAA